jgi:hypothetical protein
MILKGFITATPVLRQYRDEGFEHAGVWPSLIEQITERSLEHWKKIPTPVW